MPKPVIYILFRVTGLVISLVSCVYMMAFFLILSSGRTLIIVPDSINPIEIVIAFVGVLYVGQNLFRFLKALGRMVIGHAVVS
ncbi:hypothetical protein MUP01_12205 [Candidatus Bathyarchaeota archaeon]|nr:hypothetical protein [Candidatus Bathyarchaeota archaeon]